MALYALGDPHLSFGRADKPRSLRSKAWQGHEEKIRKNWLAAVTEADTVVLLGDVSFGRTEEECRPDFDFLRALPGRKILLRGNHDMYWDAKKTARLNEKYAGELFFLQDNFYEYASGGETWALTGTKGYCFENLDAPEHYEKIRDREAERLRTSLRAAREAGHRRFIVFLHYPPTSSLWPPTPELCRALGMSRTQEREIRRQERELLLRRGGDSDGHNLVLDLKKLSGEAKKRAGEVTELTRSPFTDLAEEYGAEMVLYAHVHGRERFSDSLHGVVRGVGYQLTSGDYLDFKPFKVLD